jgi:hypothetical protein
VVGSVLYFTSGVQYTNWIPETLNDLWRFHLDEIDGIETVELETLFYPNPTTDKITLSSRVEYKLFSMSGEIILEGVSSSIDVSALPTGVYFLNTEAQTFKVIKE